MATYFDPIALLREYTIEGKKIENHKGHLVIGQAKFPLQHPTAWKAKISGKQYNIGSLWYFLNNPEKVSDRNAYVNEARKLQIEMVSITDREEITNYFNGVIDTAESIDEELRISTRIEGQVEESKTQRKEAVREVYERPLCTKDSLLQGPVSFKNILNFVANKGEAQARPKPGRQSKSLLDEIISSSRLTEMQQKPIIVVPSNAIAGNISLQTAASFLEGGKYIDPATVPDTVSQPIAIKRYIKSKSSEVSFEIYENPLTFSKSKWRRVVALFVTGTVHHLKDWPDNRDIIKLFLKYRGYYMKYSDSPAAENVKNWNVKTFNVHRTRRHEDKVIINDFWKDLESFLNKPRHRT